MCSLFCNSCNSSNKGTTPRRAIDKACVHDGTSLHLRKACQLPAPCVSEASFAVVLRMTMKKKERHGCVSATHVEVGIIAGTFFVANNKYKRMLAR